MLVPFAVGITITVCCDYKESLDTESSKRLVPEFTQRSRGSKASRYSMSSLRRVNVD